MSRTRSVRAAPADVWEVVSDPERLPEWWPGVQRVEEASPEAWTTVLASPRGKSVRADYTLVESEPSKRLVWRHEVAESPFERILKEASTELSLEPEDPDLTEVRLTVRQRPRGLARFGFIQLHIAAVRQVKEALEGLDGLLAKD